MSIKRTAPALAISLATHTAAVLAVAATLPVMAPNVLVVELDPLTKESRTAPGGGPSTPVPAPSARAAALRRAAPAASPAPTPMWSAPVPATPMLGTPPPPPAPDVEAAPASRAEVPVASADVAPPPPIAETTHAATSEPDTAAASAASATAAASAVAGGSVTSHDGAPLPGRTELDRGSAAGTASSAAAGDLAHATGGGGAGNSEGYGPYLALLRHRIQSVLQYPMSARRRGLTGTVHVEIAVQPSGAIDDVAVIASSRHRVLDDAAVDAVRALGRVPFPPGLEPRALRARLPIVFELQ